MLPVILSSLLLWGCASNKWYLPFGKKEQSDYKKGYYYEVRRGDTLWKVSKDTGVSVPVLTKVNRLRNPNRLAVEQRIWVPLGYYYRVHPGDTLTEISRKTRVGVSEIAGVNRLRDPDLLRVGELLWIPRKPTHLARTSSHSRSAKSASLAKTSGSSSRTNTRSTSRQRSPAVQRQHGRVPMIWPIGESFQITSRFGSRGGDHKGIDLAAPEGTPVRAALDGVVIYAGSDRDKIGKLYGYGNYVWLLHDEENLITVYAHNRVNLVRTEQTVRQGQKIAEVGHTGNVRGRTGNHLHFEVRDKFTADALNPEKFLPSR